MSDLSPYLFSYWQAASAGTPGYIPLCLETQERNLGRAFRIVRLDWESCRDWAPDRDALWRAAVPRSQGRTVDMESRRIAIFTDLLRLRLLARHGGMWMDADTIALPAAETLAEACREFDFVASVFGRGTVMNGVLGGRAGSPFLEALAEEMESTLARKVEAGEASTSWGEFGFRLLTRMADKADPDRCLILPAGTLNQNRHEDTRDLFDSHETDPPIGPATLCVSLHNASISEAARRQTPSDLARGHHPFGRMYRHAMSAAPSQTGIAHLRALDQGEFVLSQLSRANRDAATVARLRTTNRTLKDKLSAANARVTALKSRLTDLRGQIHATLVDLGGAGLIGRDRIFREIYRLRLWNAPESASGCGSTLRQTETLRNELRPFLDRHGITTLLDIPCGDFNWMAQVDLSGIRYTGADIVPEIVAANARHATDSIRFATLDLVADPLPRVDCVMVRDCFSHLPHEEIFLALDNIVRSGSRFVLMTHFEDQPDNPDIATGEFHRLNFCLPPFDLPGPADLLREEHPNPKHADKTLGLWPVEALANARSAATAGTPPS